MGLIRFTKDVQPALVGLPGDDERLLSGDRPGIHEALVRGENDFAHGPFLPVTVRAPRVQNRLNLFAETYRFLATPGRKENEKHDGERAHDVPPVVVGENEVSLE